MYETKPPMVEQCEIRENVGGTDGHKDAVNSQRGHGIKAKTHERVAAQKFVDSHVSRRHPE